MSPTLNTFAAFHKPSRLKRHGQIMNTLALFHLFTIQTIWGSPVDVEILQNAFVYSRNGPNANNVYFVKPSKDNGKFRRYPVKTCLPCQSLDICRVRQTLPSNKSPSNKFETLSGHKVYRWKHRDVESIALAPRGQRFTCDMLVQPDLVDDASTYYSALRNKIPQVTGQETVGNAEARSKSSYDLTWLVNGSVVHDSSKNKAKQLLFDQSMRAMLPVLEKQGVIDTWKHPVSFALDLKAAGKCRLKKVPCFCIGKREDDAPGLLVPNPFFVDPAQWDIFANSMHTIALSRPPAGRINRAIWRGACGPGAAARLELLGMAAKYDIIDAAFTNVDGYVSIAACIDAVGAKSGMPAELRETIKVNNPDATAKSREVAQKDYSRYRYVIHMPGAATGSYSRNLQFMWFHEAIVVVWRGIGFEWYYPQLLDGVNCVVADSSDMHIKLGALARRPTDQAKLTAATWPFYKSQVSGKAVIHRWAEALAPLTARQTGRVVLPSVACSCDQGIGLRECLFCGHVTETPELPQFAKSKPPKKMAKRYVI